MIEEDNKFWYHYKKWKEETAFLSTGNLNNEHFKAICNLDECPFIETLKGIKSILDERDDFIVYALEEITTKFFGTCLVTVTGYVSLHDYCEGWRKVLFMVFEGYTDLEIDK